VFTIRTLVAAKEQPLNKALITDHHEHKSVSSGLYFGGGCALCISAVHFCIF
jgi:hypothetical protein